MSRCVVVGGADIGNISKIKSYLKKDDFYIFCDCGYRHAHALGVEPNLIVGDFDSSPKPCVTSEIIVLPCEKDDTDTMYAVKEGLRRGYRDFLLVGMIGARLDHTLGNLYILEALYEEADSAILVDDYSEMQMVGNEPAAISDGFAYFSLVNISGKARKITIENSKYPLKDGEIKCNYQYAISNEVLFGKTAEVTVGEGRALLVKVFK